MADPDDSEPEVDLGSNDDTSGRGSTDTDASFQERIGAVRAEMDDLEASVEDRTVHRSFHVVASLAFVC